MSIVEVTVRWRPGRSPGEFGELPPWASSTVREEPDMPARTGPAWDLVAELVRTAAGPLVVRVIDNRRSVFLWAEGGDVTEFFASTADARDAVPLIVQSPPGDDPDGTRAILYAMAEVGRAALERPKGGGQTPGNVTHLVELFDAMRGWCEGAVDDAKLDAKAQRAKNRGAHAPRARGLATDFANVCLGRALRFRGDDRLVVWRATLAVALDQAVEFSSGALARAVFCDHMAETVARRRVELAAAGWTVMSPQDYVAPQ